MLVRIFFGDQLKDLSLDGQTTFSVGSNKNTTMPFEDSDLAKNHVVLSYTPSGWEIACNGAVYLRGAAVKQEKLRFGCVYILSELYKISMLCLDTSAPKTVTLPLTDGMEVSIGRAKESTIYINDPLVSRHHAIIRKSRNNFVLQDLGSMNGTYLNNKRVQESTLTHGDSVFVGGIKIVFQTSALEITSYGSEISVKQTSEAVAPVGKAIKFVRSPRLRRDVPTGGVEIEAPPSVSSKPEFNLVSILLPAIGTVSISVVMALVMNSTRMMLYTLPMTLIGLLVSYLNYNKQKTTYANQISVRLDKYTAHLDEATRIISKKQGEQMQAMVLADPDTRACFVKARTVDRTLWERKPTDVDFLSVRVGSGEVESSFKISIPKEGLTLEDDELKQRPKEIYKKYSALQNAPITCDILKHQVCGIVGAKSNCYALLNNMIAQLATHHCYSELKTIVIYDEQDRNSLGWMEKLPHTMDEDRKGVFAASSKTTAETLFRSFTDVMKSRKTEIDEEDSFGNSYFQIPYYLFVIAQPAYLNRNDPITEYIFKNKDLNAGVILVVDSMMQLPKECSMIIEVDGSKGRMYHRENASAMQKFDVDKTSISEFSAFSENLSHIICDEQIIKSAIPKQYSFFEMLKKSNVGELDIGKLWASSDVTKSMAVPLGMGDGKEIYLDLHEKAHGPHGLVAGTTGSGKSELLQSYILSVAVHFHPYEVGFVIIDFKGGGMANQFAQLPHLMGTITNIEGSAIDRSLASIKAELLKRQRVFAENGVNSIDKYIEKYKTGQVKDPLPHLVIVVDEFAELKAEQPEFMKELISAARIGRSLGIHLILATQKPAGQVNEQIWSNSRFRLCLKVATREDSKEMLKSPLAFNIKEPGRAYLQVGNNEVFELFQSGYSGGKTAVEGKSCTQLEAVVEHISQYCKESGIQKLPDICLPALPDILPYPEVLPQVGNGTYAEIGIYDDPSSQHQGIVTLDLETNNILVVGSTQYGKTNLMMTMIRSLSSRYTPSEVNIYILDFGPSIISSCKDFPHVGGVVTDKEDEKLKNLFKMLYLEIDHRKEKLLKANTSSFRSYKEAGYTDMPMIVLFVDNFTALKELYFSDDDLLMPICRNGLSVGISVVLANLSTQGLGYRHLANFSKRIALFCNDSGEYSTVIDHCKIRPDEVVGRGIIELEKKVYIFQTFASFVGDTEMQRVNQLSQFIEHIKTKNQGLFAKRIPEIPEKLTEIELCRDFGAVRKDTYAVPVGVDYTSLTPVCIDLLKAGSLATVGAETAESKRFLQMIVNQLQNNLFSTQAQVYWVDSIRRSLKEYQSLGITEEYTIDPSEFIAYVDDIYDILHERFEKATEFGIEVLDKEPLLLIVVDNVDAIAALCSNTAVVNKYKEILDKLSNMKVCFLFMNIDNLPCGSYNAPEVLKRLKETKAIFFFDSLRKLKFTDISDKQLRIFKKERGLGDGYYYVDGELSKLKIAIEG